MSRTLGRSLRVIVKVGSAVIAPGGALDERVVERLAADIDALMADGRRRVVIVSSGAVASGFRALGMPRPPREIVGKQAAAAVGQPRLMGAWAGAFARSAGGRGVAQVLLTAEDIDHRTRFLNARRTLEALLDAGVVPVVNENDSVSFAEIKLGDNDHLSSLVASLVDADVLVILSSVAGVWDSERSVRGGPVIVPEVRSLREGLAHVRAGASDVGTGGMATKIRAACAAAGLGVHVVIADGAEPGVLSRIVAGEAVGTHFPPAAAGRGGRRGGRAARKRWIGFSARPKGTLIVDAGAERAMTGRGASLLPGGLVEVIGVFARGALVEIAGPQRRVFARGLAGYSDAELRAIAGKKTSQIASTLGYHYADEAVHRDDLALTVEDAEQGARA
jgi:glutamate 5-kinase